MSSLGTLLDITQRVPTEKRLEFATLYQAEKLDSLAIWTLSLLFGFTGVDRFFIGQSTLGVVKLITLGGCGLWWALDLILIDSETRTYNQRVAMTIARRIGIDQ
jgi:TM2 domain-containing membrane protein YozV